MRWSFASGDAEASRAARRAFTSFLRERASADSDILGAELTFGELVANAARYAPGSIEVAVEWRDGRAALRVSDGGRPFTPRPTLPRDPFAQSGRGLFLVARIGSDLRVDPVPGDGKVVTVTLPVREAR